MDKGISASDLFLMREAFDQLIVERLTTREHLAVLVFRVARESGIVSAGKTADQVRVAIKLERGL